MAAPELASSDDDLFNSSRNVLLENDDDEVPTKNQERKESLAQDLALIVVGLFCCEGSNSCY